MLVARQGSPDLPRFGTFLNARAILHAVLLFSSCYVWIEDAEGHSDSHSKANGCICQKVQEAEDRESETPDCHNDLSVHVPSNHHRDATRLPHGEQA